ncbi:MAG: ABC transporter ATP-binding protein [Deltaproteobacteria bacterium]|nr:ABC transporter ATP-binding protein [Deltaproteobacteria bacterium]
MLTINDLHVHYGAIHALKGISLDIKPGEIVSLIGSNGAGKTTLLRTISGLLKASQGTIVYRPDGAQLELTRRLPHQIVASGVAQVPEGRLIFHNLTVQENLELGAFQRRDRGRMAHDREFIFTLFPRLKERLKQSGGTLSGGEQQMLAIGRALMASPKLLLLDEPSLGIAPTLVQQIFACLKQINARGTTILLVEQDAFLALETAHRGYVMETGQIVLEGTAKDLLHNPQVKQAYLGQ